MGIKTYNPYTPSRRNMSGYDFEEITASTPEKSLTTSLKKHAGRNAQGKITVRHHGGGSRRKYRIIDFKRNKDGIPATVKSIEYDPNRTANIALICYADGEKKYILAPVGLKVGQTVMNGAEAEIKVGNCMELKICRLVHRFITSRCTLVMADSLFVLLVLVHSSWLKKANMQLSVCHPAR